MKTLPTVATDHSLALMQCGADPVWPVHTPRQRQKLERLIGVFEASLAQPSEVRAVDELQPRRASVVAALTAQVHDHARLYAHLTGRQLVVVQDRSELVEIAGLEVLVCLEHDVDFDLLARLYDAPAGERVLGMVFGPTLEDLEEQVLLRSAAAVLDPPATVPRADHFATADLSGLANARAMQGHRVTGPTSTPEQIRQCLGAGAGVLTLQTHCDGLDAFLRPAMGLCSIAGDVEGANLEFPPPCVSTGYCRHYKDQVSVAEAAGSLLPPQAIAARIMLMDVCWGMMPSPALMDRSWSLARQLLAGGRIGALLTTWDMVISKPEIVSRFSDLLSMGASVAEGMAAHAADAGAHGNHWCLVGDPDVAVPAAEEELVPLTDIIEAVNEARRGPDESSPAEQLPEFAFLRALIHAHNDSPEATEQGERVLASMAAYERAKHRGDELEVGPGALGPAARTAILECLTAREGLILSTWHAWIEHVDAPRDRKPCWGCGEPAREFDVRLETGGMGRYAEMCATCGNSQDVPGDGRRLWYTIEPGGVVRLHGSVDQPGMTAIAAVERGVGDPVNQRVPWPLDEHGRLVPTVRLSGPWPEDRMRVIVFAMWPDMALGRASRIGRHRTLWVD